MTGLTTATAWPSCCSCKTRRASWLTTLDRPAVGKFQRTGAGAPLTVGWHLQALRAVKIRDTAAIAEQLQHKTQQPQALLQPESDTARGPNCWKTKRKSKQAQPRPTARAATERRWPTTPAGEAKETQGHQTQVETGP